VMHYLLCNIVCSLPEEEPEHVWYHTKNPNIFGTIDRDKDRDRQRQTDNHLRQIDRLCKSLTFT